MNKDNRTDKQDSKYLKIKLLNNILWMRILKNSNFD